MQDQSPSRQVLCTWGTKAFRESDYRNPLTQGGLDLGDNFAVMFLVSLQISHVRRACATGTLQLSVAKL